VDLQHLRRRGACHGRWALRHRSDVRTGRPEHQPHLLVPDRLAADGQLPLRARRQPARPRDRRRTCSLTTDSQPCFVLPTPTLPRVSSSADNTYAALHVLGDRGREIERRRPPDPYPRPTGPAPSLEQLRQLRDEITRVATRHGGRTL